MSTPTQTPPAEIEAAAPAPRRETAEKDRLSFREKLSYGSGLVGFSFGYSGINALAYPIFNITLGVSPTLIGLVLSISRLWDAITDPWMGSISDNCRWRWGRRKPFILIGSVLCALVFPLMWWVPTNVGPDAAFWWFLIGALLFFTAFTVFSVPYMSLSYELTPDSRERTRLAGFSSFVGKVTTMSLPWVYRVAQSDVFSSTLQGMRVLSLLIGLAFVASAIPIMLNCKERFSRTAAKQRKIGVWEGIRETAKNRPFVALVLISMTMQAGMSMIGSLGIYVNSYYIFAGDTKAGAACAAIGGTVYSVLSMIAIPFVMWCANRFGKRRAMLVCLISCLAATASKFFCYTPALPWLQFVSVVLMAPGQTAFFVLLGPMKADTADYDEYRTGMRREGTYAAVSAWVEKVGLTCALFMSGAILDLTGFRIELGADQGDGVMLLIRVLFAFVPAVAILLSLYLLRFYPLTEDQMFKIRDEMEAKRGAA